MLPSSLQHILNEGHTLTDLVNDMHECRVLEDLIDQVNVDGFDNVIFTIELHAYRAVSFPVRLSFLICLPSH